MPNDLEAYRQTLLDLYLRLPDTRRRVSRHDGRLVEQLWSPDARSRGNRLESVFIAWRDRPPRWLISMPSELRR